MCVALPVVAAAAAVAGSAVSAYGAYQQGQTQKRAAQYNAEMQRQAADDAMARGQISYQEQQDKAAKFASAQSAAAAASGLQGGTGTPLQLMVESKGLGELDALKVLYNAQQEARGMKSSAAISEWQGKRAATAGAISAGASLLSGASSAYFGYQSATAGKP